MVVATLMVTSCSSDDGADDDSITDIDLEEVGSADGSKPVVQIPDEIPTELVITELIPGEGPEAAAGDTVIVDYVGVRSADGTEFDNSYDRGSPFPVELGAGRVIRGWDDGLVGSQAGERRQLDIPADLAYGDAGAGEIIQPGDALTFVVDIRVVIPRVDPAEAPLDVEVPSSTGASAVTIDDLVEGDGALLADGDTGFLHVLLYRGSDSELVVDTWEAGQPIQVLMVDGQTLPGLIEGFSGMRVGGRRIVVVPAADAFGAAGNAQLGISDDEDIVLVVDLIARF